MESTKELTYDEKVDLLGQELINVVERTTKVTTIVNELTERLEWLESQPNRYDLKNEITHLHNEMREVQKLLGMDGTIPKIKPSRKSKFD